MNLSVTLYMDGEILKQARRYAAEKGIKLDSLVETLLREAVDSAAATPIAEWVTTLSKGEAEPKSISNSRRITSEYYEVKRRDNGN